MQRANSPPGGCVVAYGTSEGHERETHTALARELAALKRYEFAGDYKPGEPYGGSVYFVPSRTIVGVDLAHKLGVRDERDLFGGVVPHPFVATKAITHPVIDHDALAPEGWSPVFPRRVHDVVLDGYSAFCVDDARRAGDKLLREHGQLRIKRPGGIGGRGQAIVSSIGELDAVLATIESHALAVEGVVLEQNLEDVGTFSVGQVHVDDLVASYVGVQLMTRDNRGRDVYGGSDLTIARGDFDALLALDHDAPIERAIAQARTYDAATRGLFPGFFATRRNYDVACGLDETEEPRSGVLEQSWRLGGASGAEIAALSAFAVDPELAAVRAAAVEVYGGGEVPAGARVHFDAVDDKVGRLTKYTVVNEHVHAR